VSRIGSLADGSDAFCVPSNVDDSHSGKPDGSVLFKTAQSSKNMEKKIVDKCLPVRLYTSVF
jgi:hypothetical protein